MGLPQPDTRYYSYQDYLTWPEDCRYELIDGIAHAMAPAPTESHQIVVIELARQIANALIDKPCRPFTAPLDVRLPKQDKADASIDTVVQPDLLVVCDPDKRDRRGVVGAPDWIIEVISPASAIHDQVRKRHLYERAGVREYWLVHPIDRSLVVYRLADHRYPPSDPVELRGQTPSTAVPEVLIDWDILVRQLPDDA